MSHSLPPTNTVQIQVSEMSMACWFVSRCLCGRLEEDHSQTATAHHGRTWHTCGKSTQWLPENCTETFPTDAFGTMEFTGRTASKSTARVMTVHRYSDSSYCCMCVCVCVCYSVLTVLPLVCRSVGQPVSLSLSVSRLCLFCLCLCPCACLYVSVCQSASHPAWSGFYF